MKELVYLLTIFHLSTRLTIAGAEFLAMRSYSSLACAVFLSHLAWQHEGHRDVFLAWSTNENHNNNNNRQEAQLDVPY